MNMMSVKTHKIIWEEDGVSYSLSIETHPENSDYVTLTFKDGEMLISQMGIPMQVAKSFQIVLRDF